MKKISVLLMSLISATVLVACNSGGGSNGGGGGDSSAGCANGATSCGASAAVTAYSQTLSNGATLIGTSNVSVNAGTQDVPITFKVNGLTGAESANISFVTNNGSLSANPSHIFTVSESTFTVTLTTGNASSYTITPTEFGQNSLPPVTVNGIASTTFLLPTGRYLMSGTSLWYSSTAGDCGLDDMTGLNLQVVNTSSGVYICFKDSNSGVLGCQLSNVAPTNTSRFPELTMPSGSKFNQDFNLTSYYSNAYWSNNAFSTNNSVDFCPYVDNEVLTYQTSSTVLPYPIFPSNQATVKSLFGSQKHVNLFGFVR